ncbi:aerobic C4-dicarboxylate transport protein [Humidesulfovibrio mexicanus]|uniref:Aerobic C4-dicarboxylate transport protein n=1 Tax=Humidesulfovibrio mexicanus TaxID=147047 RepID=A0A239CVR9_9BACT|nr:dicarboxylate/amino acid:cation symporter [Humidesulfovibrio mexicanus]SNS24019.1 aerobic C4-dicarboxylate transport protein [Humidesulfovibrio mexicanus]
MAEAGARKPIYKSLYFQVIMGICIGIALGVVFPGKEGLAAQMKPFGDAFIKMIKMIIAPIIFCTVVVGIAKMGDMGKVGRVGIKAMLYFWTMTLMALIIGLVVVNTYKPGVGMNLDVSTLDMSAVEKYAGSAQKLSTVDFIMHIIPSNVVDAFAKGEILQVLFFSIFFGLALSSLGEKAKTVTRFIDEFSKGLFKVVHYIMFFAPMGAFGAIAYVVGAHGVGSLQQLMYLMAGVYTTCIVFIFGVLWTVCRLTGFSLWQYLKFIKEEILLVLGTSSSESALPRMMAKMEVAGCNRSVVGLTLPMGYSFNLDGTCIYLTMAAVFLAQATNTPLSLNDELYMLGILLLTSKGAAAVTGGGFITLAATLGSLHTIPVASIAVLLGVDRFMSEARAITNLIGNGIATIVVAKWEGALDADALKRALSGAGETDSPEEVLDGAMQPVTVRVDE